jgi:hypothetical protein
MAIQINVLMYEFLSDWDPTANLFWVHSIEMAVG